MESLTEPHQGRLGRQLYQMVILYNQVLTVVDLRRISSLTYTPHLFNTSLSCVYHQSVIRLVEC